MVATRCRRVSPKKPLINLATYHHRCNGEHRSHQWHRNGGRSRYYPRIRVRDVVQPTQECSRVGRNCRLKASGETMASVRTGHSGICWHPPPNECGWPPSVFDILGPGLAAISPSTPGICQTAPGPLADQGVGQPALNWMGTRAKCIGFDYILNNRARLLHAGRRCIEAVCQPHLVNEYQIQLRIMTVPRSWSIRKFVELKCKPMTADRP